VKKRSKAHLRKRVTAAIAFHHRPHPRTPRGWRRWDRDHGSDGYHRCKRA
jgi:hypothetical protein